MMPQGLRAQQAYLVEHPRPQVLAEGIGIGEHGVELGEVDGGEVGELEHDHSFR